RYKAGWKIDAAGGTVAFGSAFDNMANLERIKDESMLNNFKENLAEFINQKLDNSGVLNIYTGYIQNSEINIGGSVIINRLGCYNSTIKAKKSIIVKSNPGFLKGGSYQAEEIIFTQEAGSKLSKTYFRIGEQIFIKEVLGTLVIKSENDRKIIEEGNRNINFRVNDFGELVTAATLPNINQYLLKDEG
ncbi:FapA family protein, partial [Halanaerobium sp.]|uniref:FapA family protein n=1 Tax=Halanaerobium sp. TaxID=1895664 RepID=UPI000DE75980